MKKKEPESRPEWHSSEILRVVERKSIMQIPIL